MSKIKDVQMIPLKTNVDDRGTLTEIARAFGWPAHAVVEKFGQVYLVDTPARGVIRGLHRHKHLWGYFSIVRGTAKFVLVSNEWPAYVHVETYVLSDKAPALLVVPPGIYHGWVPVTDGGATLLAIGSEPYNAEKPDEERVDWNLFGAGCWEVTPR